MDIAEDYVIVFPYFLDGPPTINNALSGFSAVLEREIYLKNAPVRKKRQGNSQRTENKGLLNTLVLSENLESVKD